MDAGNGQSDMPIGPVSDSHRQISVVEPLNPALEHVKKMLFQPFDIAKWFVIGFCAWLAGLGESGGGANFGGNNFGQSNNGNMSADQLRHALERARDFTMDNLYWIVPVAIFAFLFLMVLWVLILWPNSRGKFMFLHCVALNKAEVVEPWNKYAGPAMSLFWFRIVWGLLAMLLLFPTAGMVVVLVLNMIMHGGPIMAGVLLVAGLALMILFLVVVFALIEKFMVDFVVPIMYLRGGTCLEAWGELWKLLCGHAGLFILYILFQIVIGMVIGLIVVFAILLTCCLAGCLMIIPYIGTVLLLPVLVFKRSFSLYFLRQFGPEYDVFPPAPAAPGAPSGLQPL
jgi:hypothetical protein